MITDIIIGLFIVWGAIQGVRQGFVKQVFSLVALLLGIWGACHFSHVLHPFLVNMLSLSEKWATITAFLLTFVIVVLGVHLLGLLVDRLLHLISLGLLNRLAGLVFGVLKTGIILSVFICILNGLNGMFHVVSPETIEESTLYPFLGKIAPALFPYLHFDILQQEMNEMPLSLPI